MQVYVQTPEGQVWNGQADVVSLSTDFGMLQILPGHASLQGTITFSALAIEHGDVCEEFVVRNGFVVVQSGDEVRVMGYQCERRDRLSRQTANEYLAYLLDRIASSEGLDELQKQHLAEERASMERVVAVFEQERGDLS